MGVLASTVGMPAGANTDPMGNALIYKKMSDVGGRSDIGIMPAWHARYLASQDATALKTMLANARTSGSIPWHYRDEATGEYLRIDQHPKLWMDGRTNWAEFGADGLTNGFAEVRRPAGNGHRAPARPQLPAVSGHRVAVLPGRPDGPKLLQHRLLRPPFPGLDDGFIDFDQVRGRAWTWRNMSDSAFIAPDDSELKTYFNDMLENNMDALVKRYITNGAMDKYGQIEGFFRHDMWPDGDLLVWQSDFVAMVLGSIAERGNTQAVELLKWMDNFTSGRFIHGDDGFDPRFGAAYMLKVNSTGNGPVYTTWADFFKGSFGSSPTVPAEGIMGQQKRPGDEDSREHDFLAAEFTGHLESHRADDGCADGARVGGGSRLPRAVLFRHQRDVGVRDVDPVRGHLGLEPVLLDGRDGALGQFVVGGEDRLHAGIALERGVDEPGIVGRHGVGELADEELLIPLVFGDELLPDGVAPVEWGDATHVDVAHGDAVLQVLGHLGEHEGGEIGVVLFGLDGLGGALGDLDVVHYDRQAGAGGLVDQRAHRIGLAVVDDDARDTGSDRRLHVGGLLGVVGLGVVDLHRESDGIALLPGTSGPQLEVVTGATVLDEGNFHWALVEGSRLLPGQGSGGFASRAGGIAVVAP